MLSVNDTLGIISETNNLTIQTLANLRMILEITQHLDPSDDITYMHNISRIIRSVRGSIDRCNILLDEIASIHADAYDAVYGNH